MIRKEGLYLGWRWSQASGAMVGRCSGEAMRCRQTRSGEEDDRGRRDTPARLRRLFSAKKRTKYYLSSKFWQNLPCTVRYPKPAEKHSARWPTTTYTYALNSTYHCQVTFIHHHHCRRRHSTLLLLQPPPPPPITTTTTTTTYCTTTTTTTTTNYYYSTELYFY